MDLAVTQRDTPAVVAAVVEGRLAVADLLRVL